MVTPLLDSVGRCLDITCHDIQLRRDQRKKVFGNVTANVDCTHSQSSPRLIIVARKSSRLTFGRRRVFPEAPTLTPRILPKAPPVVEAPRSAPGHGRNLRRNRNTVKTCQVRTSTVGHTFNTHNGENGGVRRVDIAPTPRIVLSNQLMQTIPLHYILENYRNVA